MTRFSRFSGSGLSRLRRWGLASFIASAACLPSRLQYPFAATLCSLPRLFPEQGDTRLRDWDLDSRGNASGRTARMPTSRKARERAQLFPPEIWATREGSTNLVPSQSDGQDADRMYG